MPRKFLMSWEGEPHCRWVKMYRRTRYRVACADLGLPREYWTKDQSYQAANSWWQRKHAELVAASLAAHPHAELLAELTQKLDYTQQHGLHYEAVLLAEQVGDVKATSPADDFAGLMDAETARRLDGARLLGVTIPDDLDPIALDMLFGPGRIWQDRFKRQPKVSADRTMGGQAAAWTAQKVEEACSGVRSASGTASLQYCIAHFVAFTGASTPVESLDFDLWHRWYVNCQKQLSARDKSPTSGWTVDYAQKVFTTARSFVRWMYAREVIQNLPRNLADRTYSFERPAAPIPTFTNETVRKLIAAATGQHRLHLLLMLNCGFRGEEAPPGKTGIME